MEAWTQDNHGDMNDNIIAAQSVANEQPYLCLEQLEPQSYKQPLLV